jgi:hypothetical protein
VFWEDEVDGRGVLDAKWHRGIVMRRRRGHCSIRRIGPSTSRAPLGERIHARASRAAGCRGTLPWMADLSLTMFPDGEACLLADQFAIAACRLGRSIEVGIRCGVSEAGCWRVARGGWRADPTMGPVPAGIREGFEAHFQTDRKWQARLGAGF